MTTGVADLNSKKLVGTLARVGIWILVAWGIFFAIHSANVQLSNQQASLLLQAQELEQMAGEEAAESEAQRLRMLADGLRRQGQDFWKADWRFLLLAGVVYGVSLLPASKYWWDCLVALGQNVPLRTATWAYMYGNLGKYVPGKAMVIVLRVASLAPLGVRRVATTLTIFIETLTMMAVGGAMAAVCLILLNVDWRLSLLAVAAVFCMLVPTVPPLLRYLLVRLQPGVEVAELELWAGRLNWGLVLRGWATLGLTWMGFGLSLGCVLYGLPTAEFSTGSPVQFWFSSLGACALAVVVGFLSMIPGGAGVREVVLTLVLAPVVGPAAALSCAIWLRITWLVVELLMAAGFYFFRFPVATVR